MNDAFDPTCHVYYSGGPCHTQLGLRIDYPRPCLFYTTLATWVIDRAEVDLHLQKRSMIVALNSSRPLAPINKGTANARRRSRKRRAIYWASSEGRVCTNRNSEDLSTTSNKYSLPVSDVFEILNRSTSKTS